MKNRKTKFLSAALAFIMMLIVVSGTALSSVALTEAELVEKIVAKVAQVTGFQVSAIENGSAGVAYSSLRYTALLEDQAIKSIDGQKVTLSFSEFFEGNINPRLSYDFVAFGARANAAGDDLEFGDLDTELVGDAASFIVDGDVFPIVVLIATPNFDDSLIKEIAKITGYGYEAIKDGSAGVAYSTLGYTALLDNQAVKSIEGQKITLSFSEFFDGNINPRLSYDFAAFGVELPLSFGDIDTELKGDDASFIIDGNVFPIVVLIATPNFDDSLAKEVARITGYDVEEIKDESAGVAYSYVTYAALLDNKAIKSIEGQKITLSFDEFFGGNLDPALYYDFAAFGVKIPLSFGDIDSELKGDDASFIIDGDVFPIVVLIAYPVDPTDITLGEVTGVTLSDKGIVTWNNLADERGLSHYAVYLYKGGVFAGIEKDADSGVTGETFLEDMRIEGVDEYYVTVKAIAEPGTVYANGPESDPSNPQSVVSLARVRGASLSLSLTGAATWANLDEEDGLLRYEVHLVNATGTFGVEKFGDGTAAISFLTEMRDAGIGDYTFTVQALADPETLFLDGPVSLPSNVRSVRRLATPTNLKWRGTGTDTTARWTPSPNAVSYVVAVTGGKGGNSIAMPFAVPTAADGDRFTVQAKANPNSLWLDSLASVDSGAYDSTHTVEIPDTGLSDITGFTATATVFVVMSAALWGYALHIKRRKTN